jgi:pectinesterase
MRVCFAPFHAKHKLSKERNQRSYLDLNWKQVANGMPTAWYGSDEAKSVAENVLLAQKEIGGWAKNFPYHHKFSESEKRDFLNNKSKAGATFDNDATSTEIAVSCQSIYPGK